MKRLFIGLDIPEKIKKTLSETPLFLKNVNPIPSSNLHLTLLFLGELSEDFIHDIHHGLLEIQANPFDLKIKGVGYFAKGKKVKILWAGLEKNNELFELQRKVKKTFSDFNLSHEKKFMPHITLARLQNTPLQKIQPFLENNAMLKLNEFKVSEFCLFQSHLTKHGSQYEIIAHYSIENKECKLYS